MNSYFDENMKLLDDENLDALFSPSPIYTKIRDDTPTRYINGSRANNIMAADGCVIEGEAENSILFRGVKIVKGARVKNCVLMQDTVIEEGADLEYVITDKNVTVTADKELKVQTPSRYISQNPELYNIICIKNHPSDWSFPFPPEVILFPILYKASYQLFLSFKFQSTS